MYSQWLGVNVDVGISIDINVGVVVGLSGVSVKVGWFECEYGYECGCVNDYVYRF